MGWRRGLAICLLITGSDALAAEFSDAAAHVAAQITWVRIPSGTFQMGSTANEVESAFQEGRLRSSLLERDTFEAEMPRHSVLLDAFDISRTEVTNAQYRAFIAATGRTKPRGFVGEDTWADASLNEGDQPVVGVTWFDAQAFAEWIGGSLPTEAQWERAARGTDARKYPWGDAPPNPHHANFARRQRAPSAVGRYPEGASEEGALDLAGNVWEWCMDEYHPNFYAQSPKENPLNLRHRDELRDRVLRGGSWDYGQVFLRSALRFRFFPLHSTHNIGFRVVRSVAKDSDSSK